MKKHLFAAAALSMSLTACGAGGSHGVTPSAPGQPGGGSGSQQYASVTATASLSANGGPQVPTGSAAAAKGSHVKSRPRYATLAHLHAMGYTIAKVQVDGTLFPGYAGVEPITNEQDVTPVNNTVSVTMSFSNVPVGNNEWAIFEFTAVAPDGSKFYLGSLAKLVNVTATGASMSIDEPSTLRFEAFVSLLQNGLLSANYLAATPSLETQLGNQTASLTPDPTTHLYSGATLNTWLTATAPSYERKITITPPTGAVGISIASDPASAGDANLSWNVWNISQVMPFGFYGAQIDQIYGRPAYFFEPSHTPPVGPLPLQATDYRADILAANGTTPITVSVYGGPLLIGAAGVAPFSGTVKSVAWGAPGSGSLTLGSLVAGEIDIPTNDPHAFAFGTTPAIVLQAAPGAPSVYPNYSQGSPFGTLPPYVIPANYSATNNAIVVSAWNGFNLPASDFELCTIYTQKCVSLGAPATLNIDDPFSDPGTNLSYYNWQKTGQSGDATTSVTVPGAGTGYVVNWSGGTTFSIKTTTSALLEPAQYTLHLNSYPYLPANTVLTATAVDTSNNTYTATSTSAYGSDYQFTFVGLTGAVHTTSITFTFAMPAGSPTSGNVTIGGIY